MKSRIQALAIAVLAGFLAGCQHYSPAPLSAVDTAARFQARSLADPGLKQFLGTSLQQPLTNWPARVWDFDSLSLAAFYYHPNLRLAQAQWQVANAGLTTAGARPNPTIDLIPGYSFNAAAGENPWLPLVTLDWPIETAGKRRYRLARAYETAESARFDIQTTAWEIRGNLRTNLLELSSARRREELLTAQEQLLTQITQRQEQRLAAGAIARSELMPDVLIRTRNRIDLAQARLQAAEARAGVAEAVGVPLKALDGVELKFDLDTDPLAALGAELGRLRDRALQQRSDVLSALAAYAASEAALQLEIARQYPDVHLNSTYQFDQGQHKWSIGPIFELPILNQNQGPIAEAQAHRTEAAARFMALQARVIAEIDRAWEVYQSAQQQLGNFGTYRNEQKRQVDLIQAQVQAGAADPLDLLHAQTELGLTELAQLDALVRVQQAVGAVQDALQPPASKGSATAVISSLSPAPVSPRQAGDRRRGEAVGPDRSLP